MSTRRRPRSSVRYVRQEWGDAPVDSLDKALEQIRAIAREAARSLRFNSKVVCVMKAQAHAST